MQSGRWVRHRKVAGHGHPGVCCRGRSHARPAAAVWRRPQRHRSVLSAHSGRALRKPALFAMQLSSTLNQCDFHFSIDISDAYHLLLGLDAGASCGPAADQAADHCVPRPSAGPGQPSEVTCIDAMVNVCVRPRAEGDATRT